MVGTLDISPYFCLQFVAMLADALFSNPERLLTEQMECYAYMYTYASVTVEVFEPDVELRTHWDRSFIAETNKEVLEASRICKHVRPICLFLLRCSPRSGCPGLLFAPHSLPVSVAQIRWS